MKKIDGFEKYYATTCGRIISERTNKEMCTYIDTVGYKCVTIRENCGKNIHIRVHRLMAFCYMGIGRNDNSIQVNHLDGNKMNCCLLNLELSTNKENTEHGYDNNMYTTRNRICVNVYDKGGKLLFECKSMRECEERTGVNRKLISLYIKGIRNNVSDFEFITSHFDKPFRIIDEFGNDFRSCMQCSSYYSFNAGRFGSVAKENDEFVYKGLRFKKYFV